MNRTVGFLKRFYFILCFLLAFMLVTSGNVFAKSAYKIGAVFSITGRTSFIGEPERNTLQMMVKEINANGGINGHPIKLFIYDTEGQAQNALAKVSRLILRDNVLAIIGPSLTGTTMAVIPLVQRYKVPMISCAAGVAITHPTKYWVFKVPQTDAMAVKKIYQDLNRRGIKKIAIISVNVAFGRSGREQLIKLAPKYGIKIVDDESFGPTDVDMTPQLIRIRASHPQAVICWGTNPGPAVVAKNMCQLGFHVPLYMSHGVASQRFIQLAGKAAEGIILPSGKILVADQLPKSDPQRPILLAYIKEYKAKFGKVPPCFGGHAYDAIEMLKVALTKAGANRAGIRNALESIKGFVGIDGIFNMSPKDHNGLTEKAFVMVQVKNGRFVLYHK